VETEVGFSDEVYKAIRNALLCIDPNAPTSEHRDGSGSAGFPAAPGWQRPRDESGDVGVPASEDDFEGSDWETRKHWLRAWTQINALLRRKHARMTRSWRLLAQTQNGWKPHLKCK
jgi:hypothetical protein